VSNRHLGHLIAVAFLALTFATSSAKAQLPDDLCRNRGIVLGFFNGVQTTRDQARIALRSLERTFGTASPEGEPIRYEVFYNRTDGFEDFVETFEQRLNEQQGLLAGRFELFFEALRGDGPTWSRITQALPELANVLQVLLGASEAAVVATLTGLAGSPPTVMDYAEHRARIDSLVLDGQKLLFVAHSQGNLFVNAAHEYALAKVGAVAVQVVHVAPASPTAHGDHTLANLDLVINGLRLLGEVPTVTDAIPGYLRRPPGLNGNKDLLGHGFLEIYLNPSLDTSRRVKQQIDEAMMSLVAPPAVTQLGSFSVTLTWDGPGDADLHTLEPDGSHVYYADPAGTSGYLDVDNVEGFGPEHYYASCRRSELLVGTYEVAIANYDGAEGTTATVQVASWKDGVLGTKTGVLGAATGDNPTGTLFRIVVTETEDQVSIAVID
jgi:hypothetical protein